MNIPSHNVKVNAVAAIAVTSDPFDAFRAAYQAKPLPKERIANADQTKEMLTGDGLLLWSNGSVDISKKQQLAIPKITAAQDADKFLWAIEATRIPYAPEKCEFGSTLESQVIKHSNLTGGRAAHCAGEMIKVDAEQVVINGRSGRYGPKSAAEMLEAAKAFRASGYNVWSMGFDTEAAAPNPFIGVTPTWVP